MGKATKRRNERRRKFLTKLAQGDPERFEREWDKRKESWLKHIHSYVRDKACFTKEEYKAFLTKFPYVDSILGTSIIDRDGKAYISLDRISFYQQEALGLEAYNEILRHVKFGTLRGKCVFDIVEEAKKILNECGEKAMELQYEETQDVLNNECCQALAPHIGLEIYRINQRWKPKE